jgi:hypothetical protein
MKTFSPKEMDQIYERILYFVGANEREYLKFKYRRAELYYQLGSTEPIYFKKAAIEFNEASRIDLAKEDEDFNFPLLLVHEFECKLGEAESYIGLKDYKKGLALLDALKPKLRNIDERSIGGTKDEILKKYQKATRLVLRKLGRFEEADEIPFSE